MKFIQEPAITIHYVITIGYQTSAKLARFLLYFLEDWFFTKTGSLPTVQGPKTREWLLTTMQINNLNINILYFVCNPTRGQEADGTARYEDVVNAFSDIPESNISAVISSMIADKLISMGPSRRRITITKNGIHRLQASVACRIHRFDGCQCGA